MRLWKENLLSRQERFAMPIMTHPGIEMTGKRVIDAVTDGVVHYQAIRAMAAHFPTLAATMMMDLTVEAEAFGCGISFAENEVPTVVRRVVHDADSVSALPVPALSAGRTGQYLEAGRLAATNINDRPVLGGCIGPFSLAGRLFDMTEIMTAAFLEPDTIESLVHKCTLFLGNYVRAMKDLGMNGVIMAEPAAGLLDEDLCDRFSSVPVRQIVESVQDDHFLFILHNCGNTGHVTRSMIRTGAGGLHFGNRIDMMQALQDVPDPILVFGNLDPVGVFRSGRPADVYAATSHLLRISSRHRNFVISSGCDTPPGVPPQNIRAFYDAVAEYNKSFVQHQLL